MVPGSRFVLGIDLSAGKKKGFLFSLFLPSGRVEREKIKDRRVSGFPEFYELGTYEVKMAEKWYVCYCEPGKALALAAALNERGIEVECPSFEFRRRVPRRNKTEILERPLIGGIFFLGVDFWPIGSGILAGVDLGSLRRMMAPSGPAVVEDEELDGLRVASGEISRDRRSIYKGDTVEFFSGPFKGRRAKVIETGECIIRVEMEGSLGRIEIAPFLLRKIQA